MAVVRFDPFASTRDFDRIANQFLGLVTNADRDSSFAPSYDIEQHGEHDYVIRLALPGVREDDLEITTHEGVLTVTNKAEAGEGRSDIKTLYRGIGHGRFERRFRLAEHVEVAEARLELGILSIKLVRNVPDALKPRTIQVIGANQDRAPAAINAA